jgi:hypothetical protein
MLQKVLRKIVKGNDQRKSRLHDRKGHLVPMSAIVHLPHAVFCWIAYKLFGWRSRRPWISYGATRVIKRRLGLRPSSVLEFGSGMSTLWFSDRAERVCSVEHDEHWYQIVRRDLLEKGLIPKVVEYRLAMDIDTYTSGQFGDEEEFDIILVDGPNRELCIERSLKWLKDDGLIFLDNSDADSSSGVSGELDRAVQKLIKFAYDNDASVTTFVDFAPGSLFATEGYLVELSKK